MYVTVVHFDYPGEPLTSDAARDLFLDNAASYLTVPGLLFKAYVHSEDGRQIGGCYWWADRASAEAKFNPGWQAGMRKKYGADPSITWFETPVVVDPRSGQVITEPPELPAPPSPAS